MTPAEKSVTAEDVEQVVRRLALARNAQGVRATAERAGLSREELAAMLERILDEQKQVGTEDRLGARYDIVSGRYLTLGEWVAEVLKR